MKTSDESIFEQALQREDAQDRRAFLDRACANQPALRQEVESLLSAYGQGEFLESPALARNATLDLSWSGEQLGSRVGRYKLLEQIGEGGMGVVYMAEQIEPVKRRVALKIVKPGMDSRQVVARFEAERQALAIMDHPNIAKVHDAGTTDHGRPYFVMELVRGMPITEYCDQARLASRNRLELFVAVCQAVAHAHQKGIIHRDLKPSNVLITLHDGAPVPKVIDFGIAKATSQSLTERTFFTAFTQMVGTPLYMSPEQAEMSGLDVDTRSDVYSLGVLLYELLTGQTPFDNEQLGKVGLDELRRIIREEEPLRPSQRISTIDGQDLSTLSKRRGIDERRLGQSLSGELDWIVMKALEKDRNRRYESASALAADIQRYLSDEQVEACPPSAVYRLGKFARRNRVTMITVGLVAATLVLGSGVSLWQARRAIRAERLAEQRLDEVNVEKQRAEAERGIAVAVNDFLRDDLLGKADPNGDVQAVNVTVEELLDRAAAQIMGKFAAQPQVEAALQETIGEAYRALGKFSTALPHLERALEVRRKVLGEEHQETLSVANRVGMLYVSLAEYGTAEPLLIKALSTSRRVLGENHRSTLTSMHNLALLYHDQCLYAKAEPLYVRAVDIAARHIGNDSDVTLNYMHSLASLYYDMGKYDQAEALLVKALDAHRQVTGKSSASSIASMNTLACGFIEENKLDRAEELLAEALELSRSFWGGEHPATIKYMDNLAGLYSRMGQHAKAEPLYAKSLELSDRVLGKDHPDTLEYTLKLADRSNFSVAEPLLLRVLEARRRVLGEEHVDTLVTMDNLASRYIGQGQFEKGVTLHEKSVATFRRVFGDEHPMTLRSLHSLALIYKNHKQYEKAVALLTSALESSRRLWGDESIKTCHQASALAETYQMQGRHDEAEPLLIKTLEVRSRLLGDEHPDTLVTVSDLALHYTYQGQYNQAEELGLKVLNIRRRIRGEDDYLTNLSKFNLAGLYETQGQLGKAEPLFREAAEWSRAKLGIAHLDTRNYVRQLAQCYGLMGEPEKAEPLLRELAAYQKTEAGADSLNTPARSPSSP